MRDFKVRRYDQRNWVIEEFIPGGPHPITKQPGPGKWQIVGYYPKLEDLAVYLLDRQIELPDGTLETQLRDLLAELKAAEARIAETLCKDEVSLPV